MDRQTTFALMDSKSRAPQRRAAGNQNALEALAAKRRKISPAIGALTSSLPLAMLGKRPHALPTTTCCPGMVLIDCFCFTALLLRIGAP